jgi:hypothetical protein|tara:strand:- start:14 stop:652 length:639 start_codon:yes stop_codon:yes gene_type:complete
MAIPLSIERNIAQPGIEQANFVKYLTEANLPISNSKTIAYQSLYHVVVTETAGAVTSTTAKFFTGAYDQSLTNFPGNTFVLPQSQHFLVTDIQAGTWTGAETSNTFADLRKGFLAPNSQSVNNTNVNTIVNSTYTFTVNGIVMQKDIPLAEFDNTLVTQQRGRFTLSQPILIPAQSDLSLVVTAKGTGNLSPNPGGGRQTGLWFELLGIGLI